MRVDPTNPLATARGDKIGDAAFCQISLDTLFFFGLNCWLSILAIATMTTKSVQKSEMTIYFSF